jgi:hypothetical protein
MKAMVTLLLSLGIVSCAAGIFGIGYQTGKQDVEVEETELDQAFKECMLELEENCPRLYDYALTLERENARLNRDHSDCVRQLKEVLGSEW